MASKSKKTDRAEKIQPETPKVHAKKAAPASPKRTLLKTIKRAAAAPPPSPTLRRVTGVSVRRVVPKAPPAKLKPDEPPVAPPAPELVESLPETKPAPIEKPAERIPAKPGERAPAKKESPKFEPTATYKMPAPPLVKPHHPPAPKAAPASPRPDKPAAQAVATAKESSPSAVKAEAPEAGRVKIKIPEVVTVKNLADRLGVTVIEVIKKLLSLGTLVTINQQLDADTAVLAADAFGVEAEIIPILQETATEEKEDPALLRPRPPIVTIMGHVDHGKTSLLDAIRKTRVAEREAGGITQHIGAYLVKTAKGDVVFLDTPGHEAFTAMRARGAQATDIVVLVVAADDGVMPQTVEAIDHAHAAGVTIVVAVNKMDLPTANSERVKRDLSQYQLAPEEWGGKTVYVEVSAIKGTNIDKLLEMLSLESELLELKANPQRAAQGVVVEARLDPRRGVAATLLVQKGTLRVGDVIVAGAAFGKVRALSDDRGARMVEAGPSSPVEALGLSGVPQAGDPFAVLADEREARALVERRQLAMSETVALRRHVTLETLHERAAEGKIRELKVILKADVQGSAQALRDALERMSTSEIRLNVIHAGVGGINETDVVLADASDAVIIGFNVRPDTKAEERARRENVDIRTYRIIYEAMADVRAAMEGLLEPVTSQIKLGAAEVRQVFHVSRAGNIAGCLVVEGKIVRNAKARLLRDNVIVYEGTIDSLKRFKDDVREVEKGFECGISLANYQDVKPQDLIEAYTEETKSRKLEAVG